METEQVQANVAPKQVAAAPAGAPAQPVTAAAVEKPGEVPKKKSGVGKWILIIVLALVVIGLLTYVFTAIF